jgi:hypothetical protein
LEFNPIFFLTGSPETFLAMKVLPYFVDMVTGPIARLFYALLQPFALARKDQWGVLVPRKVA